MSAKAGVAKFQYIFNLAKENKEPEFWDDPELEFYLMKALNSASENVGRIELNDPDLLKELSKAADYVEKIESDGKPYYHMKRDLSVGGYELVDIDKYLNFVLNKIQEGAFVYITVNKNTLKCEILSSMQICFNRKNTFRDMLGFKSHRDLTHQTFHMNRTML